MAGRLIATLLAVALIAAPSATASMAALMDTLD